MAVSRRQKENDTFSDIASTLPIEENAKELDKASVLRLAIHYLKLRDVLADCEQPSFDAEDLEPLEDPDAKLHKIVPNFSKDVLQALDGFLMMVSKDGRILYATESISQYLGLRQVDVIGVHLQDIIHPQDYSEVATVFQSQGCDIGPEIEALCKDPLRRNFVVRMRCAFTPSVRSITRCSNFKPIYCSGFLKFSNKKIKEGEFIGMVMLCKLASVMKVKELCVGAFFKTKHGLDLGYTAVDTRIRWILGFDPAEMIGLKAYEYFHPEDLNATSSCHTTLLAKGRSHSPCYRFMTRSGDWVWVRSKSCVTYDAMTHLPNGLSIYTWIVRYEEEDERMKAIAAGEDPGNLGIKDTSSLVSSLSSSSGSMDIKELCNPRSSSVKQETKTSKVVSPEVSTQPPPNINPFQSSNPPQQPTTTTSPVYGTTLHDPFMGPTPTLIGNSPTVSTQSFSRQSRDSNSPSYITPTVYSTGNYLSNTSPPSSLTCSSPSDSCYYNGNNYPSPTNSPYDPTNNQYLASCSPSSYPPPHSTAQQHIQPTTNFAIDTSVYLSPNDFMSLQNEQLMFGAPPPPSQQFLGEFNVKQEPILDYYGIPSTDYGYYGDKTTPNSSRTKEARSRYLNVGRISNGKQHFSTKGTGELDAASIAINDISEWLQHSVH